MLERLVAGFSAARDDPSARPLSLAKSRRWEHCARDSASRLRLAAQALEHVAAGLKAARAAKRRKG